MVKKFNYNLENSIIASFQAKKSLINLNKEIERTISIITKKLNQGGKIMLCGNGGSAADAQHLAAEFIVRLKPKFNRKPIAAISLAQDTSTITACGNDYSFDIQFSRSLEALGKKNDILIAISTSGNSKNIINVLKTAKKMKIFSIGFLGNRGGKSKNLCDIPLVVNSNNTARIQETHIFLGHFIFESVETRIIR